ncbi:hypothetical protein [Streptomyces sp. HSG2]|uniref:hypothetical protein n=1 Tax=Streptomyces sp. HSG2 TaxID=2797167 RepID=UPI0019045853|nr:hypothetical protein [Streptomyces sp. HSG2]
MFPTHGRGPQRRSKGTGIRAHGKLVVIAAAGLSTIACTAPAAMVPTTSKAAAVQGGDSAKGGEAKKGGEPGGHHDEDHHDDAEYWAEQAGNPDTEHGDDASDEGSHRGGDGEQREGGEHHGGKEGGKEEGGKEEGRSGGAGRGGDGEHEGHDEHGYDERDSHEVKCSPSALASAITKANQRGGGHLSLAPKCVYTLTSGQDGNGLPVVVQPITIDGNGATIARAANADHFRLFEVGAGGDLSLRHLTLTRGKSADNDEGGAVFVQPAGRLDLDHTTFHNNSVDDIDFDEGGAIANEGVTTIAKSTFSGNYSDNGGAIQNRSGLLEVTTSKFTGNTADSDGGAIHNDGGTTRISKSVFRENSATDGGAVHSDSGLTEIEKSLVSCNSAENGGGLFSDGGVFHIRKSSIVENTAFGDGGGIVFEEDAVLEDSKVHDNKATLSGGGIHTGLSDDDGVAVRRTSVKGNQVSGDTSTGGGIFVDDDNEVALTHTKVIDNASDEAPGGIDNNGTVTTYSHNKIIDNVPTNCDGSANPVQGCDN